MADRQPNERASIRPVPIVSAGRVTAVFAYGPDLRVLRYEPATYRPQHVDAVTGLWRFGRGPATWTLYRQDSLPADRSIAVHVVGSERDADALAMMGWVAVTPGASAGPWQSAWTEALDHRPVVIHAVHDAAGERWAETIATTLAPAAHRVRIVLYPDLPPGGSVAEALVAIGPEIINGVVAMPGTQPLPGPRTDGVSRDHPDSPPDPGGVGVIRTVTSRAGGVESRDLVATEPGPRSGPPPPFPLDVLPPVVRSLITESARAMSIPAGAIAAPLLVLAGSVAGGRYVLQIGRTRRLLPAIQTVLVSEPEMAAAALHALGAGLHAAPAGSSAHSAGAARQYEDSARLSYPEADDGRDAESPTPIRPRNVVGTVAADERPLPPVDHRSFGAIAEDPAIRVPDIDQERSAGREGLHVLWEDDATAGRISTIPPARISLLTGDGRRDNSTARLLFVVSEATGVVQADGRASVETITAITRIFNQINEPPTARPRRNQYSDFRLGTTVIGPKVVLLGAAAASAWTEWLDETARWKRRSIGLEREIATGWPAQTGRLALILHILWSAEREIPVHDVLPLARLRGAVNLADWYREHLWRIQPALAPADPWLRSGPGIAASSDTIEFTRMGELVARLVNVLRNSPDTWMTRTDLARRLGSPPFASVRAALERMEADGIVHHHRFETRTRISERWQLTMVAPPAAE